MNAYSEDLRKKIVEAKERGMPTVEVARTFGVGLSSVKRYAKVARQGGSLRPKRSPGRHPKADERVRKLLEADLRERPAATLTQRRKYLRSVAGLGVSESTVSRLLRRMGWTRKKDRWEQANATSSSGLLGGRSSLGGSTPSDWYSWTRWARTPRWHLCMPGHRVARERAALYRATAGRTQRSWRA